jgi:hypothetical protein
MPQRLALAALLRSRHAGMVRWCGVAWRGAGGRDVLFQGATHTSIRTVCGGVRTAEAAVRGGRRRRIDEDDLLLRPRFSGKRTARTAPSR